MFVDPFEPLDGANIDALFEPLKIGRCIIPNRIAMAPMTRGFVVDGVVDEEAIDYYRRRAEGGVGLILTEGIAVNADGAVALYAPDFTSDASVAVWRRIVEAVHGAGGTIMAQLWHGGLLRGIQGDVNPAGRTVGPAAIYPLVGADAENLTASDLRVSADGLGELARDADGKPIVNSGAAMTERDVADAIADCARFARIAQDIGFDGIQIHGAHGYLFDQFFWGEINVRGDGYGGGIAERTRFTVEAVRAMHAATAQDFPIGLRFSQWKLPAIHYGTRMVADPHELATFLRPLTDAGVAFFDCSTRRYWDAAFDREEGTLAEWTRKLSGVPTIAVGSVSVTNAMNTTQVGEEAAVAENLGGAARMIREGRIDMIAVGRALLSNPNWANIVRAGDQTKLRTYRQKDVDILY